MANGDIFAGLDVSDVEKFRVGMQIEKVVVKAGDLLTFSKINKSSEGWFSQCNEIKGIIAEGTNQNPTLEEIESEIRQAILSAFNVKTRDEEEPIFDKIDFKFQKEDVLA